MKKSIATLLLFVLVTATTFAQQTNSLYRFTSKEQAEVVVKAIDAELQLNEKVLSNVRELIYASAESQKEMSARGENTNASAIEEIVRRQTMHIEQNMKTLIGEEKFTLYLQKKSAIEKKLQSAAH